MTDKAKQGNAGQMLRTAGECAVILKIKDGTLRKYSIEIEKAGHLFHKSERGHRAYSSDDITIIQRFIDLKKAPGMTLERSAKTLISNLREYGVQVGNTEKESSQERDNNAMTKEQMQEFMDQQQKFNKELLDRLDKQQQYIDNRLNERDRDLIQGIRELQEQKQIAATKEEEGNKKPWWKFF